MVHTVSKQLQDRYECYFSPFYADSLMKKLASRGWLDFTVLGGKYREQTDAYCRQHQLKLDFGGKLHDYDLIVTASDLIIQQNVRNKRVKKAVLICKNVFYLLEGKNDADQNAHKL